MRRQFFCKGKRWQIFRRKNGKTKTQKIDMTLVYDPTKSIEKKRNEKKGEWGIKKLLKHVEVVESQASITGTGISTEKLILGRPEVSFQTTSPYRFKDFVPMCISCDHHLMTVCINFHLLYTYYSYDHQSIKHTTQIIWRKKKNKMGN